MKTKIAVVSFLMALVCVGKVTAVRAEAKAPARNPRNFVSFFEEAFRRPEDKGAYLSFDRFWERWAFVTTRYRKDVEEMRFVFGNDLAISALKNKNLPFPEGTAFGKVAYRSGSDSAFPNSQTPEHFTRIQIMLKDSKRYSSTDGWGYFLLINADSQDSAQIQTNQELSAACHACHKLVPERDYVFARSVFFERKDQSEDHGDLFKRSFHEVKYNDLNLEARNILTFFPDMGFPADRVQLQTMKLFAGSLLESIPVLSQLALNEWQAKKAYILADPQTNQLIAAVGSEPTATCSRPVSILVTYTRGPGITSADAIAHGHPTNVRRGIVCQDALKWTHNESLSRHPSFPSRP